MKVRQSAIAAVIVFAALGLASRQARACGCVVPPDVAQPLVQAGEQILFIVENGKIEMHVKLRYAGRAGDFGWLLPLPAAPTKSDGMPGIDLGTDELFDQLDARTRPTYWMQRQSCPPRSSRYQTSCHGGDDTFGTVSGETSAPEFQTINPLVQKDSVGPYDFAVLKADDRSAMLEWLAMNGYVVPTGSDAAVAPYIRPNAFFLALKLRAGSTTGELQPVVLTYAADLPMVPITLTSVGAAPNMGILVWVLGAARAIPRNYASVVINDAQLDWLNKIPNYNDVVIRAIAEAPGKHGFVTEFADTSDVMRAVLDAPRRFDMLAPLTTQRDPATFIKQLFPSSAPFLYDPRYNNSFLPIPQRVTSGFAQNAQLFGILQAHVPMPQKLAQEGVSVENYYRAIDFYLKQDRAARPQIYADIEAKLAAFDPALLVRELTDRIMLPTLRIGERFMSNTLPKLTRLYTTLSPEDMNSDPVFSFNRELPVLSNYHGAILKLPCDGNPGILQSFDGSFIEYSQKDLDENVYRPLDAPASYRIELLRDTGPPEVIVDNSALIGDALKTRKEHGCATSSPRHQGPSSYLTLCAIVMASLLLRRRVRSALRLR